MRKFFEIGGVAAAVILIAFGITTIVMGLNGRSTVRDSITQEQIVGSPDMTPEATAAAAEEAGLDVATLDIPSLAVADEPITTGDEARAFAGYLRIHVLESTGGLTYAQMGRFVSADDPDNVAGTSDEEAALLDEEGNPVPNSTRNTWVTETALATALNMSYMGREALALLDHHWRGSAPRRVWLRDPRDRWGPPQPGDGADVPAQAHEDGPSVARRAGRLDRTTLRR
jgi:hypothetical protein